MLPDQIVVLSSSLLMFCILKQKIGCRLNVLEIIFNYAGIDFPAEPVKDVASLRRLGLMPSLGATSQDFLDNLEKQLDQAEQCFTR